MNTWTQSWRAYQDRTLKLSIAQTAPLVKKRIEAHTLLKKADSALATQIRTEKFGLAAFLHRRRVPGFSSPACPCGWHWQNPKHVIMFCRLISGRDLILREAGTNNYRVLTEAPKSLKVLTARLMKSGISIGSIYTGCTAVVRAAALLAVLSSMFLSRVMKS